MTVKEILREVDRVNEKGRFKPTDESLRQFRVPKWYSDGKFGIFIHWGAYAVPAFGNEWYPRNMYRRGTKEFEHHAATYGPQEKFGYKDFLPMFKAEKFNADEWMELFANSGARYVVPVAEHHDGFQMYASELCKFNAAQMGPGRDVLGELTGKGEKRGIVMGAASHRIEHWFFMNGAREFDGLDPDFSEFYGPMGPDAPNSKFDSRDYPDGPTKEFMDDWLARCCELVDKYRPKLFYFDWWIQIYPLADHLRRFVAYYYNRAEEWGQEVAVNFKHEALSPECAVYDIERGGLKDIRYPFWQSDTALARNSWGYTENQVWKEPDEIIGDLCDLVSKNGALLLNVGPRADGTIPEEDKKLLLAIGAWLKKNGEAIYGTVPYLLFGEGPTNIGDGGFTDKERRAYTAKDIRFTRKGGTIYAIALAPASDGETVIASFGRGKPFAPKTVNSVTLVSTGEAVPFVWDEGGLRVKIQADEAFALAIR